MVLSVCLLCAALALTGGGVCAVLSVNAKPMGEGKPVAPVIPAESSAGESGMGQVMVQWWRDTAAAHGTPTPETVRAEALATPPVDNAASRVPGTVVTADTPAVLPVHLPASAVSVEQLGLTFPGLAINARTRTQLDALSNVTVGITTFAVDQGIKNAVGLSEKSPSAQKDSGEGEPDLSTFDLVADYDTFLALVSPGSDPHTADINAYGLDENGAASFGTGDGIPDRAQILILQQVLKTPGIEFSGGASHTTAVARWQAIWASFPAEGSSIEGVTAEQYASVRRVIVSVCMFGDTASVQLGLTLGGLIGWVPIDEAAQRSLFTPMPWPFSAQGNFNGTATGAAYCNSAKWTIAQEHAAAATSPVAPTFDEIATAYGAMLGADFVNAQSTATQFHTLNIQLCGQLVCPTLGRLDLAEGIGTNLTAVPDTSWLFDHWELTPEGGSTSIVTTQALTVPPCYGNIAVRAVAKPDATARIDTVFRDRHLEQAVRVAVNKLTGDVFWADVEGLTGLDARGLGIAGTDGLNYLTSLTYLDLRDNQIIDITPLAALTGLGMLMLGHNQVVDVAPLAGLSGLVILDLGWGMDSLSIWDRWAAQGEANQITSISALSSLNNLNILDLCGNNISSLDAVSAMTSLQVLLADGNPVRDYDSVGALDSLYLLCVQNTGMTDTILASLLLDNGTPKLPGLGGIGLSANPALTTLAPLVDYANLTGLLCGDNAELANITDLSGLSSLGVVILGNTKVTELASLNALRTQDLGGALILRNNPHLFDNGGAPCTDVELIEAMGNTVDCDFACGTQKLLTTTVSPTLNAGDVAPFVGSRPYAANAVVQVQAMQSNPAYCFSHWTGPVADPASRNTAVYMTGDRSVSAVFIPYGDGMLTMLAPKTYEVNAQGARVPGTERDVPGVVTPAPGQWNCRLGETRHLRAEAKPGWGFLCWCDADYTVVDSTHDYDLVMTGDRTVRAIFMPAKWTLYMYGQNGAGTITPPLGLMYCAAGQQVPLHAEADPDYCFTGWSGGPSGQSGFQYNAADTMIIMDADYTLWTTFTACDQLPLTVGVEGFGDTNPAVGTHYYSTGTTVSLTAVPYPGWMFDHWTGDLADTANPASVTMDTAKTVTAVFSIDFADGNLLSVIRQAIGKPSGPIYVGDLTGHTELDTTGCQITSLQGLQYWNDLAVLTVNNATLDSETLDLTPLEALNNLREVSFQNVRFASVAPLACLGTVEKLVLHDCGLTDIAPLATMTGLKELDLAQNRIGDLVPLQGLILLEALDLSRNAAPAPATGPAFSSEAPLAGLTPLVGLTQLRNLSLAYNRLEEIAPLAGNTGLGSGDIVDLSGNPLSPASLCGAVQTMKDNDVTVFHEGVCTHIFTLQITGNGSVGMAPGQYSYPAGQTVECLAQADSGWVFDRWEGGTVACPRAKAQTFTMDQAVTVTAVFIAVPQEEIPANEITIADPNLKLAIFAAIGRHSAQATDPLYLKEVVCLQYLDAYNSRITSLEGIQNCRALQEVFIYENQITDVSPLTALGELTHVELGGNPLASAAPLTQICGLQELHIDNCGLVSLDFLPGLDSLQLLDVSGNPVGNSEMEHIEALTSLHALGIGQTGITTLEPLSGLSLLDTVYAPENAITDLSPLANLTGLQALVASSCMITDLTPLAGLTQLGILLIDQNPNLASLAGLEGMTSLNCLYASSCALDDIGIESLGDANLTMLQWLALGNNELVDIQPLADNAGIGTGDFVDLEGNPLNDQSKCTHIPALQARGVDVHPSNACGYKLMVEVQGQGFVTQNPTGSPLRPGTQVTLTATPPANPAKWYFDHWEGDLTGTVNPATVSMDADKTVKAVFKPYDHTLTVEVEGDGTPTPGVGTHYYSSGDVASFSVAPAAGYMLDHWEGDLEGAGHSPQLTMNHDCSVKAVFVQGTLRAAFKALPRVGLPPLTVAFADQSSWRDHPATAWEWNFGDGTDIDSAASPTHVYQSPGIYSVSLKVTSNAGSDTLVREHYIHAQSLPTASFTAAPFSGVAPLDVTFTDASLPGNTPPILRREWKFGDGGTSTAASPTHAYQSSGTYDVSLKVTTAAGSNTLTKTSYIYVQSRPTASFVASPSGGLAPLTVHFTDTSVSQNASPIVRRHWDFGDGATSTEQSPQHIYAVPGVYTASLTVENLFGPNTCTRTIHAVETLARLYVVPPGTARDGLAPGWADAFESIGDAAEQLGLYPDAEIWIAQGVYNESVAIHECGFNEGHAWVYGGFSGTETALEDRDPAAHPTILDGSGKEPFYFDNRGAILFLNGEMAVVDGLTVTGSSDCGVATGDGVNATISHCTLAGNAGYGVFLGAPIYDDGGRVELSNCVVSGNGGGVTGIRMQAIIKNTLITGNARCGIEINTPPGFCDKSNNLKPQSTTGSRLWQGPTNGFASNDWARKEHSPQELDAALSAKDGAINDPTRLLTKSGQAEWTVLVYMDGDNDLEEYAIADFLEMSEIGSGDEFNIVVLFDRSPDYATAYDNWTGARRGMVRSGDTPGLAWGTAVGGDVNMGNKQTLTDFCQWGMSSYPAARYALILWNHGGGWSKSLTLQARPFKEICYDYTSGSVLSVADVKDAICAATFTKPFSLIGFDACLMGMAEVAYEMSQTQASVMVASEDLEPSNGWPYADVFAQLKVSPAMGPAQLGAIIVDSYYNSYGRSQTMSAVDLREMGTVVEGITALGCCIPRDESSNPRNCAAKATELMTALDKAVIRERHGDDWDGSHGLSIYFPNDAFPVPEYEGIAFDNESSWYEFLESFAGLPTDSWVRQARDGVKTYGPEADYADLYAFCDAVAGLAQQRDSHLKVVNCTIANQPVGIFVADKPFCADVNYAFEAVNTIFANHGECGVWEARADAITQLDNCLFFQNAIDYRAKGTTELTGPGAIDAYFGWQSFNAGGDPKFLLPVINAQLALAGEQPENDPNRTKFTATGLTAGALVGKILRLPPLEGQSGESLIVANTATEIEVLGPVAAALRSVQPVPSVFLDCADYHITDGSAAIDKADPSKAPPEDIDGDPRPGPDDELVDIGADEANSSYGGLPETEICNLPDKMRTLSFYLPYRVLGSSAEITSVVLWYRYTNADEVTGPWTPYPGLPHPHDPADLRMPFDALAVDGEGTYEFYSIATDVNGRTEQDLRTADAKVWVVQEYPDNRIYVDCGANSGGKGKSWDDAIGGPDGLRKALEIASQLQIPEIWAAQGTYETNEYAGIALQSNVAIHGGFLAGQTALSDRDLAAHPSIISGGGDCAVVVNAYGVKNARLNGFTVTGCTAYAGIYCSLVAGDVVFEDCTLTGNGGRGIELYNDGSPTIVSCTISDNAFDGVLSGFGSYPHIVGCQISGNGGCGIWGTGVPLGSGWNPGDDGGVEIEDCVICRNGLDGVVGSNRSAISVSGSFISGNGSEAHSAPDDPDLPLPPTGNLNLWDAGNVAVTNCVISQGYAYGAYLGSGTVANCTISDNAGPGINAIYGRGCPAEVVNCILASNGGPGIVTDVYGENTEPESCLFYSNTGFDYDDGMPEGQCVGAISLTGFLGKEAGNVDGDPSFAPPISGTWAHISRQGDDLVLTAADSAAFANQNLAGHRVKVDTSRKDWIRIISNSPSAVTVRANDVRFAVPVGTGFETDGYHLQNGSNAIGRGHKSAASPPKDIDGDDRSKESGVDIGADEAPPSWLAPPQTYLVNVPAVSVTGQVCMEYVVEPGSAPVVSLDLWYRSIRETNWHQGGTFDVPVEPNPSDTVCFNALTIADGAYEFCLVAHGEAVTSESLAEARTAIARSFPDGHIYVNNQAAAGLRTGTSWDNAFLTVSDGILAARLKGGISEVSVTGGPYYEKISIPSGVTVQGGYVPDGAGQTRNITQDPKLYTKMFPSQLGAVSVTIPQSMTQLQVRDTVAPTVTLSGADRDHQVSDAGLSGFTVHPSEYFLYGTNNAPSELAIALRTNHAAPSTSISNCVFAGCAFTFDLMTFQFDHTYGIRCTDASPTLENCAFNQFQTGIEASGSSAPIMNECIWDGRCNYGLGVGVEGTGPVLNNCIVESRVSVGGSSLIGINDSNIGTCILRGQSVGTIADCIVRGCVEARDTACAKIANSILAVRISSSNDNNLIQNCAIQGNAGAGITCLSGASATFKNCVIAGNGLSNEDSAIRCWGCSPLFVNCTIADNAGTAVEIGAPDSYHPDVSPEFQNCIISGHHGSGSAGISCYRNFDVNSATGGDPILKDGLPLLTNCLFHGNDGGDLLVHEGGEGGVTRVCGVDGINDTTGSSSTIWGDPKFVRGLSGTWASINPVSSAETALEAAAPYEEAGDLAGRFLVANNKYARQIRILRSPSNPPPDHNTIVIPNESNFVLAMDGENAIAIFQGVKPGDSFHVVDYHLQNSSMAVDGGDVGSAPERDAEGNPRPSGEGAHVSIGAYEPPEEYVVGTPGPYTRVTELQGMVEGIVAGFSFNVGFVALSADTNPVTQVKLWYQFNGGPATLYGSFLPSETPIPFNAGDTGLNATGTKAGMYTFYTTGITQDGTVEDPPVFPDAMCEVVAPWDGVTPICVALDAVEENDWRQKTGSDWEPNHAFKKLSNAIERARIYRIGEIWMKQGDYTEQRMFRSGDVAIYGGFTGTETPGDRNARNTRDTAAHPTTIGTDFDWVGKDYYGNDTPLSLWCYQTHNLLLDGITFSRGVEFSECNSSNTIQNCIIKNVLRGSVSMNESSPTFSNCTITSDTGTVFFPGDSPCTMTGAYSGISVGGGAPTFTDCQVDGVFWCAVHIIAGAIPTFTRCSILSRQADPSGNADYITRSVWEPFLKSVVSCGCDGAPVFQSCSIAGCAEAGVYVYVRHWPDDECPPTQGMDSLAPNFDDCAISVSGTTPWKSHRRKEGYGVVCQDAATTPQFSRCRIQGNYVGVYADNSRADFSNCNIAGNGRIYTDGDYYHLEGAGILCGGSPAPAFTNCTVSDNPNVAVAASGLESPSLINCIITGTEGDEAVKHRCSPPPILKNCFFNNSCNDYSGYEDGVFKAARGAAELAEVPGITAPVDGDPHFKPSTEVGWWGNVPASVQQNPYKALSMAKEGAFTRFTVTTGTLGMGVRAGDYISALSNDGGLYAKSGLIVAKTNTTIDVMGDFTDRQPSNLHVVIPDYHIDNGSRALWHGMVDGAPTYDIDGNDRPGSDAFFDIGADEGAPGSRPDNVCVLNLQCPNGGQISPQAGTSFHEAGKTVSLSATDTADRGFVRWEELGAGGQVIAEHDKRELHVEMNADRTFRAVFGARITITVEKSGVGATVPLAGTHTFLEFTQATFTASPVDGSQFSHWEDSDSAVLGADPVLTFTVSAPRTVRAVFVETGAVCAPPLP
jgi:parallel beta-helix repeat protein